MAQALHTSPTGDKRDRTREKRRGKVDLGRLRIQNRDPLLEDIDAIVRQMEVCQQRFDMTCDEDLIEALIYEQKALMMRYTYLLKTAREAGIGFAARQT